MVIKDLLNKASASSESDPKVAALRKKLHKLQESKTPQQPEKKPSPDTTNDTTNAPVQPEKKAPDEIEQLAKASLDEQKRFAQQQDPTLLLKEERTQKLLTNQVSELIEVNTELQKRLKKLEQEKQKTQQEIERTQKKNAEIEKKMHLIDQRLEKFMGLYEIITNQYNPFHEEQEKPALPPITQQESAPPPNKRVVLSDGLTGKEAEIPFEQGEISSANAQKMAQLLSELEAAEKQKHSSPEPKKIVEKEQHVLDNASVELHSLLEGFEERLKEYLDDSLQDKLHETFSRLEGVLNQEIQEAVHDEVSKLKEHEDIISSALQEIESLQSDEDGFEKAKREVVAELKSTDDRIKAIPPNLYFRLADGTVLKSKQDLIDALKTLSDETFTEHVSDEHNHFADWLTMALNDPAGDALRGKSREEMVSLLNAP